MTRPTLPEVIKALEEAYETIGFEPCRHTFISRYFRTCCAGVALHRKACGNTPHLVYDSVSQSTENRAYQALNRLLGAEENSDAALAFVDGWDDRSLTCPHPDWAWAWLMGRGAAKHFFHE